jgi:membrane-bound lytic murein transglycosylase F
MIKRLQEIPKKKRFRLIVLPFILLVLLALFVHQLFFTEAEREKDSLARIRERGQLIALTDYNSLNYFIFQGEATGYQLDLLHSFARSLGVSLKIIVSNDISELYRYLELHAGDLIAVNLPVSHEGKLLVNYPEPLGETKLVLVQRGPFPGRKKNGEKFIRSFTDFSFDTIYFRNNSFFAPVIRKFIQRTGYRVTFIENKEKNPEELFRMVSEGQIRYCICPENLALVLKKQYRNINTDIVISGLYKYSWGINHESDSLVYEVNKWIEESRKEKELGSIYAAYFDNPATVRYFQSDYSSLVGDRISPFDKEIRSRSKIIHWDWRLLASLIYEESNFHTGQISKKNASGLMQLMPETAEKFGMDSSSSVAGQITAGVKYIHWLDKQLPMVIIDKRERINFILAAYNVGLGRVLAAREKAASFGKNPNKWNNNVDYYLTRRSKKEPLQKNDNGSDVSTYPEPGGFVNSILERYDHYRNTIK